MKQPLVKDLIIRYESYFNVSALYTQEVKDKICEWIDRDIAWLMTQVKKLEPKFKPNKTIVAWSGRAYMLSKILEIGGKIK